MRLEVSYMLVLHTQVIIPTCIWHVRQGDWQRERDEISPRVLQDSATGDELKRAESQAWSVIWYFQHRWKGRGNGEHCEPRWASELAWTEVSEGENRQWALVHSGGDARRKQPVGISSIGGYRGIPLGQDSTMVLWPDIPQVVWQCYPQLVLEGLL